ncbi:MAG: guanylate kinase [Acidobacteriaceae bacterium]
MAGILFIISAPSGSGKSTLVNQLRSLVDGLEFSISYTTRRPRGSEQDGREYHFTQRETFERMVANGEFLEWAEVFGNYYGTATRSLSDAAAQGRDLILDIDVQGAEQVLQKLPDAVSIFIMPPNPEVLKTRLQNRSRAEHVTDESVIRRRLDQAIHEIDRLWDYRFAIVNDVLDEAVAQLRAIVLLERLRHGGHQPQGTPHDHAQWEKIAARCRTNPPAERLQQAVNNFKSFAKPSPQ